MKEIREVSSNVKEELVASSSDERLRGWLKLGLEMSRNLQSIRTGLIHGSADPQDEARVTVSTVDNATFVLLLLRSRHTEQIQEARTLLQRVLYWQVADLAANQNGNFALYLHDFPMTYDRYLPSQLLPIFYRIVSEYEGVLGSDLSVNMRQSCERLIGYAYTLLQERQESLPTSTKVKIAATLVGFGQLWHQNNWSRLGQETLDHVFEINVYTLPLSPYLIGELILGLSTLYLNLDSVPWKGFKDLVHLTWHRSSGSYCGPGSNLSQQQSEPQAYLYDLYWALAEAQVPKRLLQQSPSFYLSIANLYPWLTSSLGTLPKLTETHVWHCGSTASLGWSYINGEVPEDPAKAHCYHPLRFVFGTPQMTHTCVCQLPIGSVVQWQQVGDALIGEIIYTHAFHEGDKESCRELILAWNRREEAKVAIEGAPASLFFLNQQPVITFPEGQFICSFQVEGEGSFVGHVTPGNRWSQRAVKNEQRYELYDSLIFLRTLHRAPGTKVILRIDMHSKKWGS